MSIEKITLGCGCFWCFEAVLQQLRGIESVMPGYAGGALVDPSYKQVCTGTTGHAEVVQIQFDTDVISLQTLLLVFFNSHDPTTLNRQGADVGTQYRSVIFYHNNQQKTQAQQVIADVDASELWPDAIVTELKPIDIFYPAEQYHHNYFNSHPTQGYCLAVISPKIVKLRQQYQTLVT